MGKFLLQYKYREAKISEKIRYFVLYFHFAKAVISKIRNFSIGMIGLQSTKNKF